MVIVYGEPIEVPKRLTPELFESVRLEAERALSDLQAEADAIAGFGDTEPVTVPVRP